MRLKINILKKLSNRSLYKQALIAEFPPFQESRKLRTKFKFSVQKLELYKTAVLRLSKLYLYKNAAAEQNALPVKCLLNQQRNPQVIQFVVTNYMLRITL